MSSFITCVSLATNLSHLHRHGMSCSHTCTCGLIHLCITLKHILVHLVITQLPKPNKDLSQTRVETRTESFSILIWFGAIQQSTDTETGAVRMMLYVVEKPADAVLL
jgi:hypothetical protein